jgi:nucleoid-associated protein YgaU
MGKLWDFFTRNEGKDVEVTSDALKKEITELGYNGDAYDVGVQDDTITIRGEAASQEEKEKVVLAMGNVKGVRNVDDSILISSAAAAENPESRQAQRESRFYTVRSGDTLSKIAREFYGDANAYMRIFEANQPMLKNPDLIYPGQALRIPN